MKKYQHLVSIIVLITILSFSGAAQTKVDLSVRPALYIGGDIVKTNQMNQGSTFVTPDKPLEVSKSASHLQQDGFHYFWTGYYLFIAGDKGLLPSLKFTNGISYGGKQDAFHLIQPKPTDPQIVGYSNGVWIIAVRTSIGLKEGANDITLNLDVTEKVTESNEKNNTHKFKIYLKP